eukprot:CAMPEP_0172449160 /NCGR_PEP_ID=MMETSP1065-20121228/7937_1 /TAXON_ID=265537 /ORGANISM="Amphiprora paludosa, Strain CCMP125" /LENGTH=335 /DNA_ID=CAMNT_0013200769 /DNA_START=233 /DNA_END=1240 /DNA_ORIENTATION=+
MFGGFSGTKLKVQLKMAVSRIQIASNKKSALLKQNMRDVAVMLSEEPPKEEMASIKAEALIRDDNLIEAYEIIQLGCELLHERIKLLEFSKKCPEDLVTVISTVIWASHRVDIPELLLVRKQFRAKYGKKFEEDALSNKNNCLNERVVAKLAVQPPAAYLVQCYLERICEQFEVDWQPKVKLSASQMVEPMVAPNGYSVPAGKGTGLGPQEPLPEQTPTEPVPSKPNGKIPPALKIYEPSPTPPPVVSAKPVMPPVAPSNPPGSNPAKSDDFDEVDIYIPPAPGAPTAPQNSKTDDDDDNNDDAPSAAGGASTGQSSSAASYEDLAARFNNLKTI